MLYCHVHTMTLLAKYGAEHLSTWRMFKDLKQRDGLVVPVHSPDGVGHWGLGVVRRREGTISLYDSLPGESGSSLAVPFFDNIEALLRCCDYSPSRPRSEWHREQPRTPRQVNGVDCGPFAVEIALRVLRDDVNVVDIDPLGMESVRDAHRALHACALALPRARGARAQTD